MSEAASTEARAVIASARALVEELLEEGVENFQRSSVAAAAVPQATQAAAPAPRARPAATAPAPEESRPEAAAPATRLQRPAARTGPARGAPPPSPLPAEPGFKLADATGSAEPVEWPDVTTLQLVREQLGDCSRCGLCEDRTTIVFGDGNPEADLMFVGEGPGEQEDKSGLPFVGRAGDLLTRMIERGLEIPRSSVYICNIVKCRPPQNRTPLPNEVATCRPFLDGQIAAVKPKVIVALGKPAASLLLGRDVAITRVRGTWQEYRGIPVMPTLHPAFVLRRYTDENRRLVWQDLQAALARCGD